MTEVTLSYSEMIVAGNAGVLRQINALRKRLHDPDAHHRDPLEAHVSGAIAEWAVAKHFGVPWDPVIGATWVNRGEQVGDVLSTLALEVRSSPLPGASLIAHDYSFDERPYVLVLTHRAPIFELCGWLLGRDCKNPRYWRSGAPRPAYFVPREHWPHDARRTRLSGCSGAYSLERLPGPATPRPGAALVTACASRTRP